ncbi:MAG: hypothetical protein H6679_00875 [Epsilonproteobacteria bacterium]|nr:hypothetical protein [Campylobacterota bacterium]
MRKIMLLASIITLFFACPLQATEKDHNDPNTEELQKIELWKKLQVALQPSVQHSPTALGKLTDRGTKQLDYLTLAVLLASAHTKPDGQIMSMLDVVGQNLIDKRFLPSLVVNNPWLAAKEIQRYFLHTDFGQNKPTCVAQKSKEDIFTGILREVFASVSCTKYTNTYNRYINPKVCFTPDGQYLAMKYSVQQYDPTTNKSFQERVRFVIVETKEENEHPFIPVNVAKDVCNLKIASLTYDGQYLVFTNKNEILFYSTENLSIWRRLDIDKFNWSKKHTFENEITHVIHDPKSKKIIIASGDNDITIMTTQHPPLTQTGGVISAIRLFDVASFTADGRIRHDQIYLGGDGQSVLTQCSNRDLKKLDFGGEPEYAIGPVSYFPGEPGHSEPKSFNIQPLHFTLIEQGNKRHIYNLAGQLIATADTPPGEYTLTQIASELYGRCFLVHYGDDITPASLYNQDGQKLSKLQHNGCLRDIAFSPCCTYILTVSNKNTVYLWTWYGDLIRTWQLDKEEAALAVAISPTNEHFAVITERSVIFYPFIGKLRPTIQNYFNAIKK